MPFAQFRASRRPLEIVVALVALISLAVPGKRDEVEEYTPMSSLISGGPSGPGGPGGPTGPGGAPGYGQQLRSSVAVPTAQTRLAPASPSGQPVQPVQVRTFTGPTRASGPAGDTAAWKDFVRDVRGRS